ncbi:MAG: cache domain-containing protein, partial [Butyrivibrio sp.]|uniref:cache domain-containing protein n=1 Tax=Butyrivibrio sp. TaxID=28121 RepID=UPI001B18DEC3
MTKEKKTKTKTSNNIKVFDSIKTRLIAVMLLVTIIPLMVAIIVSYNTSTEKATTDAIDSLDWQAWYIESEFETIIQKNIAAMQAIAAAPSTKAYFINPNDLTASAKAMAYLNTVDKSLDDGNISVLTGTDGMQLLRASGKTVDVSKREYFAQAMAGNTYVSDVITSTSTGARQATIATPVFGDGGQVIGIVQRNYSMDDLHTLLSEEADDGFISDRVGMVAAMSNLEITPENEHDIDLSGAPFMGSTEESGQYTQTAGDGESIICWVKSPTTGYVIACAESVKQIKSSARSAALIVVIIGVVMAIA